MHILYNKLQPRTIETYASRSNIPLQVPLDQLMGRKETFSIITPEQVIETSIISHAELIVFGKDSL
jgi:hypothetical protein